jgi:hypothetical protein
MTIFEWYFLLSIVAFLICLAIGVYEDLKKGPNYKFGYNMTNSLYWIMLVMLTAPVLNFIGWALFLYIRHQSGKRIQT